MTEDQMAEVLRRIRRTAEMSASIMRDSRRTGNWKGAEKVARQFDLIARLAGPPSDGAIYADVSKRGMSHEEIDQLYADIDAKLAGLG